MSYSAVRQDIDVDEADIRTPLTEYTDAQELLFEKLKFFRHIHSQEEEIYIDTMGRTLLPVWFRVVAVPSVFLGHLALELFGFPLVVLTVMLARIHTKEKHPVGPPPLWNTLSFVAFRLASSLAPLCTMTIMLCMDGRGLVNDNVISGVELLSPLLPPIAFAYWNTMEYYISSVARMTLQSVANELLDSGMYANPSSRIDAPPPIFKLATYVQEQFKHVTYHDPRVGEKIRIFEAPLHLLDDCDLKYQGSKCQYRSYSRSAPENGQHAKTRATLFQAARRKAFTDKHPTYFFFFQHVTALITAAIPPLWMRQHHESYAISRFKWTRLLPCLSFAVIYVVTAVALHIAWLFSDYLWLVKLRMLITLYMSSTGFGRRLLFRIHPMLENIHINDLPLRQVDWQLAPYSSAQMDEDGWVSPYMSSAGLREDSGALHVRKATQSMSESQSLEEKEILASQNFVTLLHSMQVNVRIDALASDIVTLDINFLALLRQWSMIDHTIEKLRVGSLLNGILLFVMLLIATVGVVVFKWQGITCISIVAAWLLAGVIVVTCLLLHRLVQISSGRREMTLTIIRFWQERLARDKDQWLKQHGDGGAILAPFSENRYKLQLEFSSLAEPLNEFFDNVSSVEKPVAICCDLLQITSQTRNRLLLTLCTSLAITLWSFFKRDLAHEEWFQNFIKDSEDTLSHMNS